MEVTSEPINNEYFYSKYGSFKIVVMTSNGYINATKLCKDYNKKLDNWLHNESSKKIIYDLRFGTKIKPMIKITSGNPDIRGTYVHQTLIVHIAQWVNPIVANKVKLIIEKKIT